MKKTSLCLLSFLLSSCASQRCDPRLDTDPFSTIGCSMSGGYDRAVSSSQRNVNLSHQVLAEQQRQLGLLETQQLQLERDLQADHAALSDMEIQLAVVNRKLRQDKSKTKNLLNEQSRLKNEISSLKKRNIGQERALATKKKQVEDLIKAMND